tara:strand:+ start:4436 stop:5947 length:1512 start_codon:yes stop_codon:yes gene_type:complete
MDAIKNNESRKDSMFEDQSPSSLYIVFFILTIGYLIVKYQVLTSSIIIPINSSEEWKYKIGRTTGINLIYLFSVIISQIVLLIFQSNSICGNFDNALQVLAQGGTAWGIIFTMIFVFINFLFSSWKGPFSNTIGYEISSRFFNLEKKEEFLANLLNDPKNVGSNAPKNLTNILTKILIDKDKKSIRQLINGITLDDFTIFINKSISENIVKNPFNSNSKSGGKRRRRKSKKGGASAQTASSETDIAAINSEEELQNTIKEEAEKEQNAQKKASAENVEVESAEATTTPDADTSSTQATTSPDADTSSTQATTSPDADTSSTETNTEQSNNQDNLKTEPEPLPEDTEASVVDAISNLFRAICFKDIISEFIWLSLAGSLSVLVSYTFLLQQKCSGKNNNSMTGKIEEENVNEDPVIKETQKQIESRSKRTDDALREEKESFTMLNDSNNNKKSFNKKFKTENFWLGQPYKSSLELGDYHINSSKEKREIEHRMTEQGETFLNKK